MRSHPLKFPPLVHSQVRSTSLTQGPLQAVKIEAVILCVYKSHFSLCVRVCKGVHTWGGMCVIVCRYACVWRRPEVDVSYSSWLLFTLLTLNPSLPLQPDRLAQDLRLRLPSTKIGSGPCTSSRHSQGLEGSEVSHQIHCFYHHVISPVHKWYFRGKKSKTKKQIDH